MKSEAEIRAMAERLEDASRRSYSHPNPTETLKDWRIARRAAARKAQALRWALGDEIEP